MNKLNKIRLAAAALLVSFAVAVPLAVAIDTGSFEMPSARAAVDATHKAEAPKPASAPTTEPNAVIEMPEVVIVAARPKPAKAPCRAQDEGTRDLVQGHGTVRTFTFCH